MLGRRIVVIGLGYVGLPLAVALARKFDTLGFDIDEERIAELGDGRDRTREVDEEELGESSLRLTADPNECVGADVYIVTVPTPVDRANRPDLSAVLGATRMLAGLIDAERRPSFTKAPSIPALRRRFAGQRSSGSRGSAARATSGLPTAPNASTRETGSTASTASPR